MASKTANKEWFTFADNLKQLRDEKGWNQQQLADKLGLSTYKTVGEWERAVTAPTFDKVMKLCNIFDCDADYLMGRISEKTHDIKSIHELTGLSEAAITKLMQWNNANDRSGLFANYLSQMIENNHFDRMMNSFSEMISSAKCWRKSIDGNNQYDMEQEKNNYKSYQFDLAKHVTNIADSIAEKEIRG